MRAAQMNTTQVEEFSTPGRSSQQGRSPERRPFLPEIDPTGSMATVRPNNMSRLKQ